MANIDEHLIDEVEGIEGVEGLVSRGRNSKVRDLIEGEILIRNGTPYHISWGEVAIYADGTIDESNGELVEVSQEALAQAISAGLEIFNMDDI